MSQIKFKQILENYSFYYNLIKQKKTILSQVLSVNEIGNNKNFLEVIENLYHTDLPDVKMDLILTIKVNNHNYFQFKLRNKSFIPAPFFRFDSDGETHRNKVDGVALHKQAVTTPHFHKYLEDGIEIAYKTDKLLNPKEAKALEDINLCMIHFFHESNTRLLDDDFPEIKIMSDTFGFKMTKEDPNQNITFL